MKHVKSTIEEFGGLPAGESLHFIDDESDLDDLDFKPYLCEKCKNPVGGNGSTERLCRVGNCVELCCAQCGYEWASFGPVGCECQNRDPKLRHIRTLYRSRKR